MLGVLGLCVVLARPGHTQAQTGSAVAPAPPAPPAPPAGELRIELRATPGVTVRVADLAQWALYVRLTNLTSHAVATNIDASELTVNGVSAGMAWSLAISNGLRDQRFGTLPPRETVETGRAMQDSLFHGPGVYAIQLRVGGNVSMPLVVRVRP